MEVMTIKITAADEYITNKYLLAFKWKNE